MAYRWRPAVLALAAWVTGFWAVADLARAGGAALPAPIAQASRGQAQCYGPDPERRTCQALAGYVAGRGGGIDNTAVVLISQVPPIVMRTVSPVRVRGGMVCGPVRPEDLAAATFQIAGAEADPAQTARLRELIQTAQHDLIGHEVCTAYVAEGDALVARARVEGLNRPAPDVPVIWVSPGEGWRVAP